MAGIKKRIGVTVVFIFIFFVWLWCLFAIYFFGLPGNVLPLIAVSLFGLGVPLALIFFTQPQAHGLRSFGLMCVHHFGMVSEKALARSQLDPQCC